MSPRPNARRPALASRRAPSRPIAAPGLVDRPEFAEVLVRLLEVVPEDRLELLAAIAFGVDLVGPFDELDVHRRARTLEQAVVDGVAHQVVVEAEARIRLGRVEWPDEALARQRL